MFRRSPLPCTRLIIALGLAVIALPAPALSQDSSTQERLDRLERDLNMLQRQVYRGVPPPAAGGDHGAAVNAEVRMDRLESEMRDLTGRVEEVANKVEQVRQRVEQISGDVETGVSQPGAGTGSAAAASPAPEPPSSAAPDQSSRRFAPQAATGDEDVASPAPAARDAAVLMPPGTVVPPPSGPADGPTPIFGTLTPPGTPRPAAAMTGAAQPPPGGVLPSGSATEQYNRAFGLLKKADYPAAETALKAFVAQYPRDPMAGNAQYWLGETYYTRGRYMEAASAFAEGYKRYPKSAKAPDGLLRLGMALARANQKQNACLALTQLDHDFPHPGAAIKEHAVAEKKRLGC